jgi:hypothetical protein
MGAGPMTGGGRGRCNPANVGVNQAYFAGLGRRRGFGGGFAGGMGRGRGRRWVGRQPMAFGFDYPMEPAAEIERLQAEAETLTKTLDWLNARIKELQGKTPEQ